MGNVLSSEIYEPQIPIKENKVVFDGSQQADCRDSGSLVGQLATLLPLILMTEGEKTHSSWPVLLWTMAKVTSAAAPFLRILSFKKASASPKKALKPQHDV